MASLSLILIHRIEFDSWQKINGLSLLIRDHKPLRVIILCKGEIFDFKMSALRAN